MPRRLISLLALVVIPWPAAADDSLPPGALLRLGDTRFLAGGPVERLEFSADARQLTAWTRDPRSKTVWDTMSWQPVRTRDDIQLVGAVVRWQPNAIPNTTCEVVINPDGVAVVRDFQSGKDVVRLSGHHCRVTAVAVSADGKRIAT
ncbi:MAG TPA: WD40 repeat domain-containing protein, partial [Gemmataceae bacterium]|nr:WD40 repeat domain-containing protein [Gemmataceae bacterium]